jgi:hypothetical protein
MEERKRTDRVFVRNHEGKRPLGRPGRRWEDNIKMDFKEWIHLAQNRESRRSFVKAVIKLRVP